MPYYQGTITITYVSDEPLHGRSIEDIMYQCDEGCAVAGPMSHTELEVSKGQAKRLAVQYGSDLSFFER